MIDNLQVFENVRFYDPQTNEQMNRYPMTVTGYIKDRYLVVSDDELKSIRTCGVQLADIAVIGRKKKANSYVLISEKILLDDEVVAREIKKNPVGRPSTGRTEKALIHFRPEHLEWIDQQKGSRSDTIEDLIIEKIIESW